MNLKITIFISKLTANYIIKNVFMRLNYFTFTTLKMAFKLLYFGQIVLYSPKEIFIFVKIYKCRECNLKGCCNIINLNTIS